MNTQTNAPSVEELTLERIRLREVQAIGAALSRKDFHATEQAYNQLRDQMDELLRLESFSRKQVGGVTVKPFQERVADAHVALFHDDPTDLDERRDRFFEEATETVQALGMSEGEAHELVAYTFGRPPGDVRKEIGAAALTLASLCVIGGWDVMECAEADLEKLQQPETIARIRAKRSTRHGRGPLPGLSPALATETPPVGERVITQEAADAWMTGTGPDPRIAPHPAQPEAEGFRDILGRRVREAWVKWALAQPNPKPSWIVPYDELSESDKEADRQIGEALTADHQRIIAEKDGEIERQMQRAEEQWAGWVKEGVLRKAAEARTAALEKTIRDVRAEFHTDYVKDKLSGVSYASDGLKRVIALLDKALSQNGEGK